MLHCQATIRPRFTRKSPINVPLGCYAKPCVNLVIICQEVMHYFQYGHMQDGEGKDTNIQYPLVYEQNDNAVNDLIYADH